MNPSFLAPSRRSRVEAFALLTVIVLLGALAVIQNRWLAAIAEAERVQLTEEAAEKTAAIAQDVDRELTRVFLELRIDAKLLDPKEGSAFARQLERFRADSRHPDLVKDIFVAERTEKGPSRLLRFDPPLGAFVGVDWPAPLEKVKAVVEALEQNPPSFPGPGAMSLPPVMADVPALLFPVMNVMVRERSGLAQIREMFVSHLGRGPVEIVLLDPKVLRESVVAPAAASRLGSSGPFVWSAVRSDDDSLVAGAAFSPHAPADATAPLLRLRFDDFDRSLLRGVLPGLAEVVKESSVRLVVQMSGPGGSVHASVNGKDSDRTAPWTLKVRHREGSIFAAVRSQQRRNTLLSASILGVLGLSAGLVFFSARRLRQVATSQVEFVAAVSHELRTPLAVIRSAAENLADGVVQEKDQTKRYGALIRDESVRLADMVEHVLEFAGADSPGRASRGPMDVVEAAREAALRMSALIAQRNAKVSVEAPPEPLRVSGDLSHLTRAISNLLGNALKYGGETPEVTIRLERTSLGVRVSVADRGAGLASSEISHLFEPFYRGQRASEAQIPGSGLGLALVKSIVESHGGKVSARNRAEGGALFTLELPAV